MKESLFQGGKNVAVKITSADIYTRTRHFYKEILQMPVVDQKIEHPTIKKSCVVDFGSMKLWLDFVELNEEKDIWLELRTPDINKAMAHLATNGIHPNDEIEQIPEGMHWIKDPAGTVLLVDGTGE